MTFRHPILLTKEEKQIVHFYTPLGMQKCVHPISADMQRQVLQGIAVGDIAGSRFEFWNNLADKIDPDTEDLLTQHYFTDDTVCAAAVFHATETCIRNRQRHKSAVKRYAEAYQQYVRQYPDVGYGWHFASWALYGAEDENEYCSFGNGSAMRSGVIGSMFADVRNVILYAYYSALPSHAHPLGIKGAVVTAVLVWMALHGCSKTAMQRYACSHYPSDLNADADGLRPLPRPNMSLQDIITGNTFTMNAWCESAVPLAFISFFESDSFESCIRNSLRYDSDTDTVMAISGGIAAAFYFFPTLQGRQLWEICMEKLPQELSAVIAPTP